MTSVILQLICPDRAGLVSALSSWIFKNRGNIHHADHHTDEGVSLFLSRLEWDLDGFRIPRDAIDAEIQDLANSLSGKAQLYFSDVFPKVAIFVSKQSHCLLDLLGRVSNNELRMNIPLIISNHDTLRESCNQFKVEFNSIPIDAESQLISKKMILDSPVNHNIDLVVLAKYMQILSPNFLQAFLNVINIHHSFLPAFKGAKLYHRAWKRGVKLILATAHYVTDDLDDAPIIDQAIAYISHHDEVEDLIRKGRGIERIAIARALTFHLRRQVMVYEGRTAIFA